MVFMFQSTGKLNQFIACYFRLCNLSFLPPTPTLSLRKKIFITISSTTEYSHYNESYSFDSCWYFPLQTSVNTRPTTYAHKNQNNLVSFEKKLSMYLLDFNWIDNSQYKKKRILYKKSYIIRITHAYPHTHTHIYYGIGYSWNSV